MRLFTIPFSQAFYFNDWLWLVGLLCGLEHLIDHHFFLGWGGAWVIARAILSKLMSNSTSQSLCCSWPPSFVWTSGASWGSRIGVLNFHARCDLGSCLRAPTSWKSSSERKGSIVYYLEQQQMHSTVTSLIMVVVRAVILDLVIFDANHMTYAELSSSPIYFVAITIEQVRHQNRQ